VVITGRGCVTPLGNDVESTWQGMLEGKSGAAPITHFDASKLDVRFACEVKNFDPTTYINKKDIRRMDRFIQLGMAAALQAIAQAKLDEKPVAPERIATYLASGMGGLPMIEAQHCIAIDRPDRMTPFFIPAVIPNLLAGQISILKGFKGPSVCHVSACSSSGHAIGEAARLIERGDADVVVAGGAEATVCMLGIAGFANMKALSTRNDEPQKASRPFDTGRDGFVMGEGGAVLVLESLESAEKRGVPILGEVIGYGANSDAYHMTSPSEGGEGAADCMRLALHDAGLEPTQVEHVNMHGTSTPAGDVAESLAIRSVFGAHADTLNCVSTKSMTGHLLGAAGALEALVTSLALDQGRLPPTINLDTPDPQCTLNYTAHRAVERKAKVALSNSFGFGGTNVSLVLRKV
jgi:3-oxoacyl-[acyl-carrier-protein] synthase II